MRYFIYLDFDGAQYHGWQIQPNGNSVQAELEKALFTILRTETPITGAGRTDAGVHARLMVAHFDGEVADCTLLADKLNRLLPPDISIHRIAEVQATAHARFDALYRTYEYHITLRKNPFSRNYSTRVYHHLDFSLMNQAAEILKEYTDFTSFSKLHTDVKTNNCEVVYALWSEKSNNEWVFTITANRFLRNMVRSIVGTLFEVGKGKLSLTDFRKIIEAKDRGKAGSSAPATGLYLCDIGYPSEVFKL